MAKDRKIELLKQVKLFTPCNDKELRKIAALVDSLEADEGKVLIKEGDPGHEFFVVAEGNAVATLKGKKLAELGAGSFFGEMSLLDHGPRSATVTAKSAMRLYVLDGRSFGRFLEEVPTVARKIMRGLAERLRTSEGAPQHEP